MPRREHSHFDRPPRARAAAAGLLLLLSMTLALTRSTPSAAAPDPGRPNVVVVLTDDQSVAELTPEAMPKTTRALADSGTTFTDSIVSSPLCCPSRAGFLTGEYPHNSGVFDNEPGYAALTDKGSTVYSWLQAAGYRTGHVGRYLLNYDRETPPGGDWQTDGGLAAPPGLDDWFGYVGARHQLLRRHPQRQRRAAHRGRRQARLHDPRHQPPGARLHPRCPDRPAPVLPHARPRRPPRRPVHRPGPLRGRRPADPRRRQARQVAGRAAAEAALVRRAQRLRQAGLDRHPPGPRPHATRRT